jgi:AmmeMemoRadiSam system protein B
VTVRPPAVAGLFYPAGPAALGQLVDELLDAVPVPDGEPAAPAYVVPHAGYRYSGPTAAYVYARLRRSPEPVRWVVLLGPAHRVPVRGCVVPAADAWRTPLGAVPVAAGAAAALVAAGHAVADDAPLAPEHSLEVQLPFLQRLAPAPVGVLPIAVGLSTVDDVAAALRAAVAATGPGTVILCSTDLSHYLDEAAADAQDAGTAGAVLDLEPERIGPRDACGAFALRGLLGYARLAGLRPALLYRCTSAQTGGDPGRVVGYAAFSLSAQEK